MAEEKNFERIVKKWLKERGYWYMKVWGGGFQRAGIPDILACVRGRFVALELKAENGRLSELQKYNLRKIENNGGFACEVKPSNWDEVKGVLENLK